MENISYVGLSQQVALQEQMNITANNLANMSTPGFKAQQTLFIEYLSKPKQGESVKQVLDFASYRDLTNGTLKQTFNDLDVAIQGDGYFAIETPAGIRYSRDGSFALNANNEIVNKSGYRVMGEGDAPITVQPNASKITITADGSVSTDVGAVGAIKVVNFDNQQALREIGNNLYEAGNQPEIAAENARVVQGSVESSNVNPVVEMNKMIEVLRQYQSTQRMLMNDHERIRSAIQKLAKA